MIERFSIRMERMMINGGLDVLEESALCYSEIMRGKEEDIMHNSVRCSDFDDEW